MEKVVVSGTPEYHEVIRQEPVKYPGENVTTETTKMIHKPTSGVIHEPIGHTGDNVITETTRVIKGPISEVIREPQVIERTITHGVAPQNVITDSGAVDRNMVYGSTSQAPQVIERTITHGVAPQNVITDPDQIIRMIREKISGLPSGGAISLSLKVDASYYPRILQEFPRFKRVYQDSDGLLVLDPEPFHA